MKVAIIPARGGSKRIPRKNIRPFRGKPMIAWSIEAAITAACFDRVVVSTDDEEISAVARSLGAEVPFKRPARLSDDFTGTVEVVGHAVEFLRTNGTDVRLACCIYATAPFVRPADLLQGLALLEAGAADYAISVTSYPFPVQRAVRINAQGRIQMFWPEEVATRSQDLVPSFHDAGQFYWGRADAWLDRRPLLTGDAIPVLLPRHRVQDIDTPEDWLRAEVLHDMMHGAPTPP